MSQRPPIIRPPSAPLPAEQFRGGPVNVPNHYYRPETSQKPHTYGVKQALPYHPYRRSSYQPPSRRMPVVEKREKSVEVQMEDVGPQQQEEQPYKIHLTAEARKRAATRNRKLNLTPDVLDTVADLRQKFYGNLKNLAAAIPKSVANKTQEDIAKHRLELAERRLESVKEQRQIMTKYPIQYHGFKCNEERTEWLNRRATERNHRLEAFRANWDEQKTCRQALMASLKNLHADAERHMEELSVKGRKEALKRLELDEEDKIEKYIGLADEADDQAREEQKKTRRCADRA